MLQLARTAEAKKNILNTAGYKGQLGRPQKGNIDHMYIGQPHEIDPPQLCSPSCHDLVVIRPVQSLDVTQEEAAPWRWQPADRQEFHQPRA